LKKIFAFLTAVLILCTTYAAAGPEPEGCSAYLLMDFETGQVLEAYNIDAALPPASITKLMTMHLVFEALANGQISLADEVKASANASNFAPDESQIFLGTGEVLTVEELLKAVATISANDAGTALVEHIAGSESAFVAMMNEKARELGMANTTFVNSHGLHHPDHVMSARDIAILTRATIMSYPEILDYSSIKFVRLERDKRYVRQGYFDMPSTFAGLIGWRGLDGLKTGWTPEAKRCIVVTAEENGRRYIAVVMGAETTAARDQKVKELLSLGLDHYAPRKVLSSDDVIETIKIKNAKVMNQPLVPAQDVTLVMRRDMTEADFERQVSIRPGLKAPLNKGDAVGTLTYTRNGEEVASVDLVVQQDVGKANFLVRSLRFLSDVFADLGKWILGLLD